MSDTLTVEQLLEWRRARAVEEGGRLFLGIPDRWLDDPTFRCVNGHVSKRILKSEVKGDLCLECGGAVVATFPEDSDGPLPPVGRAAALEKVRDHIEASALVVDGDRLSGDLAGLVEELEGYTGVEVDHVEITHASFVGAPRCPECGESMSHVSGTDWRCERHGVVTTGIGALVSLPKQD